ncbi:MAG: hypothetical protein Q7T80_18325 [Methanoregula sp.]|nr:hypothetical protein [Methanoregula sp.]
MDTPLDGYGSLLSLAIAGIILVVIIAVALFIHRSKTRRCREQDPDSVPPATRHRFDYQPEAKPIPLIPSPARPAPLVRGAILPKPKDIDLTTTCNNLNESLIALLRKYSLDNFTIATADGLIFGSTQGNAAWNDAATYSELFKNNSLAETPGVALFGLTHKGSELIGIIRTKTPLPESSVHQITADAKVILNHWV